jgi:hypothetical protein
LSTSPVARSSRCGGVAIASITGERKLLVGLVDLTQGIMPNGLVNVG